MRNLLYEKVILYASAEKRYYSDQLLYSVCSFKNNFIKHYKWNLHNSYFQISRSKFKGLQRCIRIQMDKRIQFELLRFIVLHITRFLMPVVTEMDNAVRFTSQLENDYYIENLDKVRMKFIIYTKQSYIIPKSMLYLITSIASLRELVMLLFSYNTTKVLKWLTWLLSIYRFRSRNQNILHTVHSEYSVCNCK
jgi:hypothetical protein